jgi:hypothetical protein
MMSAKDYKKTFNISKIGVKLTYGDKICEKISKIST